MEKTLTIVVAALNEEENIQGAVESIIYMVNGIVDDYEILIFNDGSTDNTASIADRLAKENPKIKVTHFLKNRGLSNIARTAIQMATQNYITWFPGHNTIHKESMKPVIEKIGEADIIVAHAVNSHQRPFIRRNLSRLYTFLMNILFGFRLKYYNGPSIFPAAILKKVKIECMGYDFFVEILVRCLRAGCSFKQVSFVHKDDPNSKSKAVSWKNLRSVIRTTSKLLKDVYFTE